MHVKKCGSNGEKEIATEKMDFVFYVVTDSRQFLFVPEIRFVFTFFYHFSGFCRHSCNLLTISNFHIFYFVSIVLRHYLVSYQSNDNYATILFLILANFSFFFSISINNEQNICFHRIPNEPYPSQSLHTWHDPNERIQWEKILFPRNH